MTTPETSRVSEVLAALDSHVYGLQFNDPHAESMVCMGCNVFDGKRLPAHNEAPLRTHRLEVLSQVLTAAGFEVK